MFNFTPVAVSENAFWSAIFGLVLGFVVHFVYYWYLFYKGDKKYF